MVIKITYYRQYGDLKSTAYILIEKSVDYNYIHAIFDSLIHQGLSFDVDSGEEELR
jgi:hypothetical protein